MSYSYKNQEPIEKLPHRIRLSNGLTRTDASTFTEDEILDAGYVFVEYAKPTPSRYQKVQWNGHTWELVDMTDAEKTIKMAAQWKEVRTTRDNLIANVEWRISRYSSQTRLGIIPTDDINTIDEYINNLRDITKQEDPFNIVWPQNPFIVSSS